MTQNLENMHKRVAHFKTELEAATKEADKEAEVEAANNIAKEEAHIKKFELDLEG